MVEGWRYNAAQGVITDARGVVLFMVYSHEAAQLVMRMPELVSLLRESKRKHDRGYNEESCDYPPCPLSYEDATLSEKCTCGADAWNARVDAALAGRPGGETP